MKNATLRQLKVFETAARHLSFSRAAQELHLTQPAVSAQIRELEDHAGLPLFERLGRRLYLTDAGREMLIRSRAILDQFRDAEDAMARLKGVEGGTLSIAVISAGDYFFPRLLAAFTARHPGVRLDLSVHNREGLLRCLDENVADLAVMVRPPSTEDMTAVPFAPHRYVVVAAPSHALADGRPVALERLMAEPFIVREHGSDTAAAMREAFGDRYDRLKIAMEIASNETIKQAVMSGLGLGFLSAHAIALERELNRLAIVEVPDLDATGSWYAVHRTAKRLPPVAAAFRAFLLEEGAARIAATAGAPGARAGSG